MFNKYKSNNQDYRACLKNCYLEIFNVVRNRLELHLGFFTVRAIIHGF